MRNVKVVQIATVGGAIESSFHADQSLLWAKLSKMNVSKVTARQTRVSTKKSAKIERCSNVNCRE